MTNVKIKEVSIHHPENKVSNDFYIKHFKDQGKDIARLLEHLGRDNRYLIPLDDPTENTITMAAKASKKVLNKAGLTGKDIDMIIFTTQTPEQMLPTNALYIHHEIEASSHTITYDLNGNCAGMNIGVEQAVRNMQSNPSINRVLVIGSDHFAPIVNPKDELTYPFFGDAACAIILEKTKEECGFIHSHYHSNPKHLQGMVFPEKGLTNVLIHGSHKYLKMSPFDDQESFPAAIASFQEIYKQYNLKPNDIKYCLSQTSLATFQDMQDAVGIQNENLIFVADRFGYTGTSSTFLALHEGIENGQIKRGDYVLFWTIGTGYQFHTMLFQY